MKVSQEDQFLRMLRDRGDRGVHTFEMRKAYIGNPSERKRRLEARGHVLAVGPKERLNGEAVGVRYFLVFDAETPTKDRGSGDDDRVGQRDSQPSLARHAVSMGEDAVAGTAPGAEMTRQAPTDQGRQHNTARLEPADRQSDPIQNPATDAVPAAVSRAAAATTSGSLFDAGQYRDTSPYEEAA